MRETIEKSSVKKKKLEGIKKKLVNTSRYCLVCQKQNEFRFNIVRRHSECTVCKTSSLFATATCPDDAEKVFSKKVQQNNFEKAVRTKSKEELRWFERK